MPISIDSLDDPVITDETPLFNAGQVSNARPANIPANGAFSLQNCEISTTGRITTRRGTGRLGDPFDNPVFGLIYYKTPTDTDLIAFADNTGVAVRQYRWTGAAWTVLAVVHDYDDLPFNIVQGVDKMWITQFGHLLNYWNGATMTGIGGAGNTVAPVNPKFCEWHTNRLVLSGLPDDTETVSFSAFLDGTLYDHANWDIDVGKGDGDAITGIRSWTNANLVVFKEHSTWIVNCDPTRLLGDATLNSSAFPVNQVHKQIGCLASNTAVQAGADIFFLSESGVRSVINTIASESQSQVGPALSDPVDDIIKRINMAAIKFASAAYWQNKYMLAIPLDSATYPNYVLVYNTLTQSWSGYWTGWTPLCWARRLDSDTPKLVFGQSDGAVTDFLDTLDEESAVELDYEDQAVAYPTMIESHAFTCGDQDAPKTGLFTRMEFKKSQGDVTVSAIAGRNETPYVLDTFSTASDGFVVPFTLPLFIPGGGLLPRSLDLMVVGQWNECRIRIDSAAHKISLNKISVGAFMNAFDIQE